MIDPTFLLPEGRSRETRIRRDARGKWWNGEDPITHALLVTAFESWIERAEDGRLCLKNDINWAYVAIDGAPYFVRSIAVDDAGRVTLSLSGGLSETLDPATLRQDAEGALYCDVKGGTLAARFDSHAAMQLWALCEEDADGPYLRLGAAHVRPPVAQDPLASPSVPK